MRCASAASADGSIWPNTEPWNSFEPDLVTTLTIAPVARPNSALYPPVMTSVSWMNSLGRFEDRMPNPVSVVLRPSTTYVFSAEVAPANDTP